MRLRNLSIIFLLLVVSFVSPTNVEAEVDEIDDISILAIIEYSFGWSYFEFQEQFEEWGCNFTTAGPSEIVQGCFNQQEPRSVETDLLFSDIDEDVLLQFDCLVVPSGGHWHTLGTSSVARNIINMAYNQGLLLAGICVGIAPLGSAGVLDGVNVTGHDNAAPSVRLNGGVMDYDYDVISDQRIVTGGTGGGIIGSGYLNAPHERVCIEIVKQILGYSYLDSADVLEDVPHTLSVNINEEILVYDGLTTPPIENVVACVYPVENSSQVKSLQLESSDVDTLYTIELDDLGLVGGEYLVDLVITDENGTAEIVRNATSLSVEQTVPVLPLAEMVIVAGVAAVVVLVFALWRWKYRA